MCTSRLVVRCLDIGIHMDADCAPNFVFVSLEYSYVKVLIMDNLCMAKWFSHTVRYMDDLLTLINNTMFEGEM